jgi:hypothetical protein
MTRPSKHSRPINGLVLYQARRILKLTPAQVSDLTRTAGYEIDDSHLSKLELGKIRHPRPPVMEALIKVTGLTDEQLRAPCGTCGGDWSPACMDHSGRKQHIALATHSA